MKKLIAAAVFLRHVLAAAAAVLALSSSAAVYRTGLKQFYFNNGKEKWDMSQWDPSPMVMGLGTVPSENVDYTLGVFAGELTQNMNGNQSYNTDLSQKLPRTAVNPVSGKTWGWDPMYSGFVYDGWMWMEKDVTYTFGRASFGNGLIIYIDGKQVALNWTRSSGDVTPSYTGWHPLRVALWTHDWQAGHDLRDFAAVYWNTSGIPMPSNDQPDVDWTKYDWSGWHRLFDDGTAASTPLRCAIDKSFVEATVAPAEGGYNVTIVGSVDLRNVVARLAATAADPETPSAWAVSSEPVSVTAVTPAVVFLPWIDDSVPYFTVYAEGEDAEFNEGYRAFSEYTAVEPCVASGLCKWTGLGDGSSWTDKNNWDLKRAPMVGDEVRFEKGAAVTLASAQTVKSIQIADGANVSFSGGSLSAKGVLFDENASASVSVAAPFLFLPDETGTNVLFVAAGSSLDFAGDVDAASASTVIAKRGPGTVSFAHAESSVTSTKPTFSVEGGVLNANAKKCVGGTLLIGGGEDLCAVNHSNHNATASMTIKVYANGVFNLAAGGYDWNTVPGFSLYAGGVCRYGSSQKCGKFQFYGGVLEAMAGTEAKAALQPDGNPEQMVYANDVMSVMSLPYKLAGNEYPHKFNVQRGAAPVDLLISGMLYGTGGDTDTHYKKGNGIVLCTATNSFPTTTKRGHGFEIRDGTWIADGASAFGDCPAYVLPGATLGGLGVIGGSAETANLEVTGAEGSPATVRPGSIDVDEAAETCGDHVYGTLTVGSDDVANTAAFGENSALEIGFGGGESADALHVHGAVTIAEKGSVLRLVNETSEGDAPDDGNYVVLSSETGITGTFETVECVGFQQEPKVVYTEKTIEVVKSSTPPETCVLTIPACDNMSVRSVRVAGVDVIPAADGTYVVEKGSVVTLTFEPAPGWALSFRTTSVVVTDDMTLPLEDLPSAVGVAAQVMVNEVMAKNGVTLKTKNGYEGLDWIELRNNGGDDVNVSGWYCYNDPTAKQSKWTKIQGSCVIPAHGYRVVWCDKDGVCPDDGFAADEAYVRFNVSTDGGKTVFLATDEGEIVSALPLAGGIKDVSYGLGHLSRTVVPDNSAAEYRVGEGDWKKVDGPVGMSAAVSDFQVVTYTCNREISNMDGAESILRDPSAWTEVRTNGHSRIAFVGSNEKYNFPDELYSAFDTSVNQRFILVVTGTVQLPRSGDWTFDVCSDDGFTASLSRLDKKWSWDSRGIRGYQHSLATFNLEEGSYEVRLVYFQNGGGYALDFSAAEGRYSAFDGSAFKLVGLPESGVVFAGALGAEVAADVSAEMVGKSRTLDWRTAFALDEAPDAADGLSLFVRYADGFTAKLNGKTVASAAATGARSAAQALSRERFVLSPADFVKGRNVLEIEAVNDDISDTEFYLSAELVHDLANDQLVYFPTPTPGAANETDGRTGFTPEVTFGTAHGWKDAAFDLTLTCPGNETAAVYYTLDGTSPKVGGDSTFRYDGPIRVSKTTVVRAAVPDVDSILQVDRSATYLFYDDIIAQGDEPPPGFPANEKVNHQRMLYGMNKVVTEGDDDTKARLKRGLTENCRTVSLVIDPRNLFDGMSGIFVNASGNGRDWERPTMVEQINPMDPKDEFSVPAGLRIRGGLSRSSDHPKHSFRLFFRSEYGMGTLEHPLFGDEGTDEFEKIDLRTSQNYGWANNSGGDTFIHELWSRDSERAMGKTYNRSRYYHLFINGVYWGLYMTEERVDQNYAKDYNGGIAENYDVVRTSQPGYSTGVAEGETEAWTELWRLTTQEGYGAGHETNYNKVRGRDPDGTRNPALPVLLNETNLIEHILTAHFVQDGDAPVNSGGWANNIIGFRNRHDGEARLDGFLWNRHDAEHSLGRAGGVDSFGAIRYGTPEQTGVDRDMRALGNFNPNLLHWELMSNAEYRVVFADLVYRHMVKKDGALTAAEGEKRYRARMDEIDDAIVAESARWGCQYGHTDRNRADWLKNCENGITFINKRPQKLISEYQRRQWYPSVRPATLVDGSGAEIPAGATIGGSERVYLSNPDGGKTYYTIDGGDPRAAGGAVAAGASEYAEGLEIPPTGATIAARVLKDGEWSPLETISVKGEEVMSTQAEAVRVAAVYSSTADGGGDSGEFVILTNVSPHAVDLTGVTFACCKHEDGKVPKNLFTVAGGRLEAGAAVTIAQADCGWEKITNGKVDMTLTAGDGKFIQTLYVDAGWWDKLCDGTGVYFVAKEFGDTVTEESQWRPSESWVAHSLRFLEMDGVPVGGGDSGEYFILSNTAKKVTLDLSGVRVIIGKSEDVIADESSAKCKVTIGEMTLAPGATVRFDQATCWNGKKDKITNGDLIMRIYDAEGELGQNGTLNQNAPAFERYRAKDKLAVGESGPVLRAVKFDKTFDDSAWTEYTPPAPMDWPEDPETEITEDTKPADLGITDGAFAESTPAELRKLAKWAKANEVAFGGTAVNAMAFDEKGNPATVFEEAYLLNCAPTEDEVKKAKAAFKFDAIVPGEIPTIEGDFNGTKNILGATTLENGGDWEKDKPDAVFFKATLTR